MNGSQGWFANLSKSERDRYIWSHLHVESK